MHISCVNGKGEKTYHGWPLTGRVGYGDKREVEIVQIYFTLRLELVEEVEQAERESRPRAGPSCWKQAGAKKLATA